MASTTRRTCALFIPTVLALLHCQTGWTISGVREVVRVGEDDTTLCAALGDVIVISGVVADAKTQSVVLKVDRKRISSKEKAGPYELLWRTDDSFEGEHSVDVVVELLSGKTYFERRLTVTLKADPPLSISSPAPGTEVSSVVTVQPSASSGFRPKSVELMLGRRKIAEGNGLDPLTADLYDAALGKHVLLLRATDAQGRVAYSRQVEIVVAQGITVTPPSEDGHWVVSESVPDLTLTASVSPTIRVAKTVFVCDGKEIATGPAGSTSATWNALDLSSGKHRISAVVTDEAGHVYQSPAIALQVHNQVLYEREQTRLADERQARMVEKVRLDETQRERWRRGAKQAVERMRQFLLESAIKNISHPVPPPRIGRVNALTVVKGTYGAPLTIEASVTSGTGKTEVAGRIGGDFKASAKAARSFAARFCDTMNMKIDWQRLDITVSYVEKEGQVVDGASAGIAIATAIISDIVRRPVRADVAMTGSIGLHGEVDAVSGIAMKAEAAFSNQSVRTLIAPGAQECIEEVLSLPLTYLVGRRVIAPTNMHQVLRHALVGYDDGTCASALSYFAAGLKHYQDGKLDNAFYELRQALGLTPEDVTVRFWMALMQVD